MTGIPRLDDPHGFIRSHTALMAPPLVPEVQLHLAVETVAIWEQTEEALGEMGLPPPFWAFAWAGGQALARYCLDNPGIVAGKRVLDFAAGGAVSGIAAMKAGAASVEACELDAFAIAAIETNAAANGVMLAPRLNARGATVLIGDPGRSFLPQDKLERLAEYTVPVTRDLEDREVRQAKVWKYR